MSVFTQTHSIVEELNLESLLRQFVSHHYTNYFELSITMYVGESVHVYYFIYEFHMPFFVKINLLLTIEYIIVG